MYEINHGAGSSLFDNLVTHPVDIEMDVVVVVGGESAAILTLF